MRTGTGPCGPGALSWRTSTCGGVGASVIDMNSSSRTRIAGSVRAVSKDSMPSSRWNFDAWLGWTGTRAPSGSGDPWRGELVAPATGAPRGSRSRGPGHTSLPLNGTPVTRPLPPGGAAGVVSPGADAHQVGVEGRGHVERLVQQPLRLQPVHHGQQARRHLPGVRPGRNRAVPACLLDRRGEVPADVGVARAEVVVGGVRGVGGFRAERRVQPDQAAVEGVGPNEVPKGGDDFALPEALQQLLPAARLTGLEDGDEQTLLRAEVVEDVRGADPGPLAHVAQ